MTEVAVALRRVTLIVGRPTPRQGGHTSLSAVLALGVRAATGAQRRLILLIWAGRADVSDGPGTSPLRGARISLGRWIVTEDTAPD